MSAPLTIRRTASDTAWSDALAGFADRPLYASSTWAAYKRRQGWQADGILVESGGQMQAAALVQSRRLLRLGPKVTLIQGGPLLQPGADAQAALAALLKAANPLPWGVELLYPAQALSPALEQAMTSLGFVEVAITGTGTVLLDLGRDDATLRAALSKNWRHNLNRAEKKGLEVRWVAADITSRREAAARMAALYAALVQRKGFAGALDAEVLIEAVGEDSALEFLEVWKDGVLHASRMGWMGGRIALDLLAASSDAARNSYANYLALWTLIERSRQRGADLFDCGGIDPAGNEGVYNFKKGLSGEEVALGRLWLRTRPGLLRPLVERRLAGRPGGGA
jgi:lipid II:glycine glycyltransferase (peptidoglycan interpeptide bridge formation enzyme)